MAQGKILFVFAHCRHQKFSFLIIIADANRYSKNDVHNLFFPHWLCCHPSIMYFSPSHATEKPNNVLFVICVGPIYFRSQFIYALGSMQRRGRSLSQSVDSIRERNVINTKIGYDKEYSTEPRNMANVGTVL